MSTMNVLAVGASRNIGHFSCIRLLDAGATVTFLLRNTGVFDADETIQRHVKGGKARLVQGDALVEADVENAWSIASKSAKIDAIVFTVGGTPSFSLTRGFVITPEDLVTRCLTNVLCTVGKSQPAPGDQPRIVVITACGVMKSSRKALPIHLKLLYSMLKVPHEDKAGAERVLAHCAGWTWDAEEKSEPGPEIMGSGEWAKRENLPGAGELKRVLVIRPVLLTDGVCVADGSKKQGDAAKPYRVGEGAIGGSTVSRKDVGHFVADALLNHWDEWENKRVEIAY